MPHTKHDEMKFIVKKVKSKLGLRAERILFWRMKISLSVTTPEEFENPSNVFVAGEI